MNARRLLAFVLVLIFVDSLAGVLVLDGSGLHKHHSLLGDQDCVVCRVLEAPASPNLDAYDRIVVGPATPEMLCPTPVETPPAAPHLAARLVRGPPDTSV